ncbi:MAG: cytochrome c peroxidase [Pseudomonadota bacterium]
MSMKSLTLRIAVTASAVALAWPADDALAQGAAKAKAPALATLAPPSAPVDNPTTPAKVELGKLLFWDGRLSGNGAMGCVACHRPDLGWGTGTPISFGYPGTQHWRNSQTILNSAYYNKLFWEGSVTSLEAQAPAAAEGAVAGNGDTALMEMRLRLVPEYRKAFKEIFGTEWPNINDAWKAIAAYQRTIVSDPKKVPFDRYLAGDKSALSDSAKKGLALFEGKAGCISCHNGALVSDQKFYNTGVPAAPEWQKDELYQITFRWEVYQKGVDEKVYRTAADDHGLYYRTLDPKDIGKFRTPSLRELKYTAPFMHNGVLATLKDVVEFYDKGGGPTQTAGLKPLKLSDGEKADLVAFLESLSMTEPLLVADPKLPPSEPLK